MGNRINIKSIGVGIFLLVFLSIFSCSDDQCNVETDTLLKTELIVNDPDLKAKKFLDSLSVYSPEWPDSIHFSEDKIDNSLSFMLSPLSDTTQIIITSNPVVSRDTISIFYQRNLVLLSPECGFVVNFSIDSIKSSMYYVDSISIIQKEITTFENDNIKIYF